MYKYFLRLNVIILIILSTNSFSQQWIKRYDGPGRMYDAAYAIAVDDDGNVYVTGESTAADTFNDCATVKYSASGVELWVAQYNGPDNDDDWASAITIYDLNSIYVTGVSKGSGTSKDYVTIKYDSSGVEQWVQRYNGPGNGVDIAEAIGTDNTGNIYVTGVSYGSIASDYDYTTIKYNAMGIEKWVVRYNSPNSGKDVATAMAIDANDNIYVTGMSEGISNDHDYVTVKYDTAGTELWVARYDGPVHEEDEAWAIAVDNSGNICVTGFSFAEGQMIEYATVKYNTSGVEQWVARYHGPFGGEDIAAAIAVDNVNNVYVTGQSWEVGPLDFATVKYDSLGVEQWVVRYNGPSNGNDGATAIVIDDACDIYVTGWSYDSTTGGDYVTVKYDSSGGEQWVARYNGPTDGHERAEAITLDNNGSVYVTGFSWGDGNYDYTTIKYSSAGIEENKIIPKQNEVLTTTIFRGPLILPEGKSCKIFDITGREVKPHLLAPGIYFIEIDGVVTQKVVKVR